jgi:hypothetical protein
LAGQFFLAFSSFRGQYYLILLIVQSYTDQKTVDLESSFIFNLPLPPDHQLYPFFYTSSLPVLGYGSFDCPGGWQAYFSSLKIRGISTWPSSLVVSTLFAPQLCYLKAYSNRQFVLLAFRLLATAYCPTLRRCHL